MLCLVHKKKASTGSNDACQVQVGYEDSFACQAYIGYSWWCFAFEAQLGYDMMTHCLSSAVRVYDMMILCLSSTGMLVLDKWAQGTTLSRETHQKKWWVKNPNPTKTHRIELDCNHIFKLCVSQHTHLHQLFQFFSWHIPFLHTLMMSQKNNQHPQTHRQTNRQTTPPSPPSCQIINWKTQTDWS